MGKINRPDTLVSEITALKRRVAQLETQQRLSAARISSGQLNVGAAGADGQIEIDATDQQIRILRDGQVIAALSTTDGLYLSGYAGAEFANGITIQPTNANGSDFAPANVFSWTDSTTGENQTWISGPYDQNRGNNSAGILLRGSDATNGGSCSMYLDANTIEVGGELKVDGALTYKPWTPAVTGGGSATYSTLDGWYWRLGNLVFINGYIAVSAAGSGSTQIAISLPATPYRGSANRRQVYAGYLSGGVGSGASIGPIACTTLAGGSTGIDQITMCNGTMLTGAHLTSSSIITVQGIIREA